MAFKEKTIEFKCDCGCPSCGKVRFVLTKCDDTNILEVCWLSNRQKHPKIGVCFRNKEIKKLLDFIEWDD